MRRSIRNCCPASRRLLLLTFPSIANTFSTNTRFALCVATNCRSFWRTAKSAALCIIRFRCTCNAFTPTSATAWGVFPTRKKQRRKSCRFPCFPNCVRSRSSGWRKRLRNFTEGKRTRAELLSEVEQRQQEQPQPIHKVPVIRSDFHGHRPADPRCIQFVPADIQQRAK